jgi:ParB family chromosome partitioning protein
MQKKGLGRGLSALIPAADEPENPASLQVGIDKISPNPFQPRRSFDEAGLDELAASIREKGILQPLLVRRSGSGYQLIAGERRFRAAVKAGLHEIPALVRDVSDHEALQLALVENLQRQDLNAIEEAHAYKRLQEEFSLSQDEIAAQVGKSRPAVANSIRLLLLPEELLVEVAQGRLPAGQARALLGLERRALILAAARQVIGKGLSARQAERLVQRIRFGRRARREGTLDPDLRALTERLQRWLGTKVRVAHSAKSGRGKIEIEFYSTSDFDRITRKITENQI